MVYAGNFYIPMYKAVSSSPTTSSTTTTGVSPLSNTYQQQQQQQVAQQRAASIAAQRSAALEAQRSNLAPVPLLEAQQKAAQLRRQQELLDELTVSAPRPSYNPVSRVIQPALSNSRMVSSAENQARLSRETNSAITPQNGYLKPVIPTSSLVTVPPVSILGPAQTSQSKSTRPSYASAGRGYNPNLNSSTKQINPFGDLENAAKSTVQAAQSGFGNVQNYFANSASQLYAAGSKNLQQGKANNNFLQYELGGVVPEYGAGALQMVGFMLGKTGNVGWTPYTVLGGVGSLAAQTVPFIEEESLVGARLADAGLSGRSLVAARAAAQGLLFGGLNAGLSALQKDRPAQVAENFGIGAAIGVGSELGAEYLPRISSAIDDRLDVSGRINSAATKVASVTKSALQDIDRSTLNAEDFTSGAKGFVKQGVSDLKAYPQSLRDLDASLDSSLRNVASKISNNIREPFYRAGLIKPSTEFVPKPNYDFSDLKGFYDTTGGDMFRAEYNIARRLRPSEGPLRPNSANSSLENASKFFSDLDKNLGKDFSQTTTKSGQVLLQVEKPVVKEADNLIQSEGLLQDWIDPFAPPKENPVTPYSIAAAKAKLGQPNSRNLIGGNMGASNDLITRAHQNIARARARAKEKQPSSPDFLVTPVQNPGLATTPTTNTSTTPTPAQTQKPSSTIFQIPSQDFLYEQEQQQLQDEANAPNLAPFPLLFPGQQTGGRKNYTKKNYGQGLVRSSINLNPFGLGQATKKKSTKHRDLYANLLFGSAKLRKGQHRSS